MLGVVDLTRKAGTKVSQLSGGEKRRLDFATAVYGTPELVFLDEPTTGLDIQSRDALWDAVDRLREDGSTIVLTTHYLEEAQQRADRIGLMHQGAFHREGTVAELTRTLPAAIHFALPPHAPAPPLQATRERGRQVPHRDLRPAEGPAHPARLGAGPRGGAARARGRPDPARRRLPRHRHD